MIPKHHNLFIVLLAVVVLIPTLWFPPGTDEAAFSVAAHKLLSGEHLYHNIIDVKPPLIYELYAVPIAAFGLHPVAPRVLDIVFQVATCWLLFTTLFHHTRNVGSGYIGVGIYLLLYLAAGAFTLGQVEGFVGFFLMLSVFIVIKKPLTTASTQVLIGLCCGAIFCLKYTMGLVLPVWLLMAYFQTGLLQKTVLAWVGILSGFALTILLVFLPVLIHTDSIAGYITTMKYMQVYAQHAGSGSEFWFYVLRTFASQLADVVSLSVIILAAGAIVHVLLKQEHKNTVLTVFLATLALVASVIFERRLFDYHLTRIFIGCAFLAAVGYDYIAPTCTEIYRRGLATQKFLLLICITTAIIFSPIARTFYFYSQAIAEISHSGLYYKVASSKVSRKGTVYTDIVTVARYINTHSADHERVLVMSLRAPLFAFFSPVARGSAFNDSHFYLGNGVPQQWKQRAAAEMSAAQWVVLDNDDAFQPVMLHTLTSFEACTSVQPFATNLRLLYTQVHRVGNVYIYKKNTR